MPGADGARVHKSMSVDKYFRVSSRNRYNTHLPSAPWSVNFVRELDSESILLLDVRLDIRCFGLCFPSDLGPRAEHRLAYTFLGNAAQSLEPEELKPLEKPPIEQREGGFR